MNLQIQNRSYLVVNEWEFIEGKDRKIEQLWEKSEARKIIQGAALYKGIKQDKLVLIYEIENLNQLQKYLEDNNYKKFINDIAPYMASDFHQGIYGLVNVVKPRENFVPSTKYIQLRSIEVPLSGIDPYLEWRKNRIFKFVKNNDMVHSFLSFHSFFATDPGVLFIAEFDKSPKEFRDSFLTPEYQEIIKEAGHDHIKGGLHTFEYQLAVQPEKMVIN